LEATRQREQQEFLTRVSQALKGEAVEWERYDRHRLEALERYATLIRRRPSGLNQVSRACLSAQLRFGNDDRIRTPATPQAAFQLLMDLRIWSVHENLFLLSQSNPVQFPTKVLEVAKRIPHP